VLRPGATAAEHAQQDQALAVAMGFVDAPARPVQRASVQRSADAHTGLDDAQVHAVAAHGIAGAGTALPHLDAIQRSFGPLDVSGVTAHVGGAAADASAALGAHAYATGDHVAFAEAPSLALAAHEAAHVVQQRAGVHLSSAVGQAGDAYEQHADAVAARVVAGESAVDLFGSMAGAGVQRAAIQRRERPQSTDVGHDAVAGAAAGATTGATTGKDVRARIFDFSIVSGATRATISAGSDRGVAPTHAGYLIAESGQMLRFVITDVTALTSHAYFDVSPDFLRANRFLVVNPSSMPADQVAAHNQKARVRDFTVTPTGTRIVIGFGRERGALMGMKGFLVDDGGRHVEAFTIDDLGDGFCAAHVTSTPAQINGLTVLLNPS
jgi:hypothetical protein